MPEEELLPARQLFIATHQLLHLPEWEQQLLKKDFKWTSQLRQKEEVRHLLSAFEQEIYRLNFNA